MEALVSHGKVDVLIHSLLVAEAWRERVFPLLREHLARRVDSAISWSLLFHETALANLLEVALFHRCACEAASEDMLLELADWAYRKLTYLNTDAHKHSADTAKDRSARQLLDLGPEEHLDEQLGEVTWGAGMCGLTIMRYLAEHLGSLPLGVMARLVSANDTIMALMPLVAQPPWARTHKGKMERYIQGYWQVVEPADRLQLALPDAQVWLALHNLLLEPACRAKYDPDEYRREALQKLRRHMHEPLLDQLPVLKDLQRLLDEMAVGADSGAHDTRLGSSGDGADQGISYRAGGGGARNGRQAAHLILEQVPTAREAITRGRDWPALAAHIRERWLGDEARRLARKRAEHMLKSFEFMCSLEPEGKQRGSRSCSQDGLALQLRLKRAAKPVERDPVAGVWYVYHPVGGAITMRVKQADRVGGGGV
ncbi:hypothetical protein MNEG_1153 [Monoraphidium neglectum]|uniref:Zinc finger MYND domain-containing protein 10 n=1 Tax=Monoraphidium neglectum TaxID=145388 RepID=A0A0D2N333_9CHLO|nr:hypothetical protein MNEG_1153 [Monoraphidium neglectum]KIZ06797.1 hypothetical protein MNEG_1153 [Monoraphidium neglectum]|eukprot:XP_013905816.1 hypothetical protein MNEG_1153 [Monoraphidium neglectum]